MACLRSHFFWITLDMYKPEQNLKCILKYMIRRLLYEREICQIFYFIRKSPTFQIQPEIVFTFEGFCILSHRFFHVLKGQFQVTLHALMAMSDLQLYPWNITLINNGENIVVFLTEKVFISVSFSIASFSQKNALSQKKLQKKINSMKKKNIDT